MARNKKPKAKQYVPTSPEVPPVIEGVLGATTETAIPVTEPLGIETEEEEAARWKAIKERLDADKGMKKDMGAIGDQKLFARTRPGYYRRWINDDGNRLAELARKGYDFVSKNGRYSEGVVSTDSGEKISQIVGLTKTNDAMRAYLMEIPEEWVAEDREDKEQNRREVESNLRRGSHGDKSLGQTGRSVMYDPTKGNSHFDTQ